MKKSFISSGSGLLMERGMICNVEKNKAPNDYF